MVGEGAPKISDFFGRILDHQVGAGHLSPVFGLDQKRIQLRSLTQSVHGEKMHANMGTVPIRDMGKEDGPWDHWSMISTSLPTDFSNDRGPFPSILQSDLFEPARDGFLELESDPIAGAAQFVQTLGLAFPVASEGHGDVYDPDSAFSQEAEGQATDHALVVRMGREDEGNGGILRQLRMDGLGDASERQASPMRLRVV